MFKVWVQEVQVYSNLLYRIKKKILYINKQYIIYT